MDDSEMPRHLTRAELEAGLPHIIASPADNGVLEAIVVARITACGGRAER